jgi:integrase
MRDTKQNKLTQAQIKNAPAKGVLSDGGGLYVRNRLWVFRYTSPITGKERDLSLGPIKATPLKAVRERAQEYRGLLAGNVDPHDHEAKKIETAKAKAAKDITFGATASRWVEDKLPDRKSPKNRLAIRAIIIAHLHPLASIPIAGITSAMIAAAVKPLKDRPAQRDNAVSIVHSIFTWAYAADILPEGLNPARRKKLGMLVPKRDLDARPVRHNRFVPLNALPVFIAQLKEAPGNLARCLEFIIHTGLRQNEAVSLRWDWVNLNDRSITIPAPAMKAKKDHTVYLADRPFEIIMGLLPQRRQGGLVFRGGSAVGGIGLRSLGTFVRENFADLGPVQIHGSRAALKSWAIANNQNRIIAEMALAHRVGDAVEDAYINLADLPKAREAFARDWSAFLTSAAPVEDPTNIVPLKKPAGA